MSKKITIGLFNDSFFPVVDGVVMVIDNYARRLSKYANVIVFVPDYYNRIGDDSEFPYKVVRCRSLKVPFIDYSLSVPKLDKFFKEELNKYDLDIVHIHSPFTIGRMGIVYAKNHHIPCVATMHSQFKRDVLRYVKSDLIASKINYQIIKCFDKCDECWAVNSEIARIFYEDYHVKRMPKVMNNATEMTPVKDPKKSINFINKKHHLNNSYKVFLFVGRINKLKNVLFIADSIKSLKEKKPHFKFKMIYVGGGQDEQELKEYITKLNLEEDVIMTGNITDRWELASYYQRADLLLFPSFYDASSIVQIEAASQKTPGIFLENTATSATVTDNVNGYISKNSKEAYSDKIIEVLSDPKKYKAVCEKAYQDLYKTWSEVTNEIYNNYIKLIEMNSNKK